MIELRHVCKQFQGPQGMVCAVDDVSLNAQAGQFIAVQGPSGCGKTTLLLAIGGLQRPDRGTVRVAGQEPHRLSAEARAAFRAATIGFVFQQYHLIPYLTVLENVLAPCLALGRADAADRAMRLISHFGLAERARHVPAALSSGERQRAALARALFNEPKVILADEPTGNLDHDSAQVVLKYLAEFAQTGGAVLMVTHDPRAAQYAHRTLHMNRGKLSDNGVGGGG